MKKLLLLLLVLMTAVGCDYGSSIIENGERKARIAERLAQRAEWIPKIDAGEMSANERAALEFLYAYMPLGDVADYDMEFYRANVAATLEARAQMDWGRIIPENEFVHFVLPIRVNNENMDTSRRAFYAELKGRVKGLSMKEAILEVNHWCHEKVSYTPSDSRTISPASIVRNAEGRCGEQSTFAVAALRAVGIPARQIYVGRWAHTDDNHAWVEAWAADADGSNGKWYYLGAGEPEPVLNTGWFDAPSTRSLMMFTKAFGDYYGQEEILGRTDAYTEINVTSNYAPTARGVVAVKDSLGKAVEGAEVTFATYNYASYYPTVRLVSDSAGVAGLSAGLGDMVIFAAKDGQLAVGRLDFRKSGDTLQLVLGALPQKSIDWDLIPPAQGEVKVVVTPEQREANNVRFATEDSIRAAYVATFISRAKSDEIASEIGGDSLRVWNILSASRGNYAEVVTFLVNTPKEQVGIALDLLEVVSVKDLRDTPSTVFFDHLYGALPHSSHPHFKQYILNPRIDNELLTPYRSVLGSVGGCSTVDGLLNLVLGIKVCDTLNPAGLAITPLGVNKLQRGDSASVERYAIALLRSHGIPARKEPLTGKFQYFDNNQWHYISTSEAKPKGLLKVDYKKNSLNDDPKHNTHFTLAKWDGSSYKTIELGDVLAKAGVDMGAGESYQTIFSRPLEMESGNYLLITGTRLADGTVLNRAEPLTIEPDKETKVELVMRTTDTSLQVIGSMNPETLYVPQSQSKPVTLMTTTGRGYFVLALIDAKKEPTTHLLRDLNKQKEALEAWGRPIVLVLRDKQQMESFSLADFPAMPSNVSFGYDNEGQSAAMLAEMLKIKNPDNRPILVVADTFGRVVYLSTGYNISLGEQLKTITEYL